MRATSRFVLVAGLLLGAPSALPLLGLNSAIAEARAARAVAGVLLDAAGHPLAGVEIRLVGNGVRLTTRTDMAGAFRFDGLAPGSYDLTAKVGGSSLRSTVVVGGSDATVQMIARSRKSKRPEHKPEAPKEMAADRSAAVASSPTPAPSSYAARGFGRGQLAMKRAAVGNVGVGGGEREDRPHDTEAYARIDDNPFRRVSQAPLSTFSIDVDTASYANVRRFLKGGALPPRDAVRIEEMLNYFRYADAAPKGEAPVAVTAEVAASPWHEGYQLLRVAVAARAIAADRVPARNLVFLLDVSGSMGEPNKLPLLQSSMHLLTETLRPQDRVAIVVYAGASGTVLEPTAGDQKDRIRDAITNLEAGGSTNGAAGIELAYQLAARSFIKGGINRVILATDGDFNVGVSSEGELTRMIEDKRRSGVFLSVLGFGMGNLKDSTMEKLADRGDGNYAYIDSIEEAKKVLVAEAGATLVTVAKDVKLQLEFNPARIAGYRLVGYENRALRDEEFNDDKKDAGEMGSGHHVTALYELVPAGQKVPGGDVDKLKYQGTATATPAAAAATAELLTIKVRYKAPTGGASKLLAVPVAASAIALARASSDLRFAVAVAGFGMLLRESPERGAASWRQVLELARGAVGEDPEGYRKEFVRLATAASSLAAKATIAR
jgi:Ca-activated chloride channel family protein